ncbi:MAG: hypothetical protein IMW94_01830 [Thermoanaerobacter sp.]|nr:hypothetical protein [Thermoanaerobacter sp.]
MFESSRVPYMNYGQPVKFRREPRQRHSYSFHDYTAGSCCQAVEQEQNQTGNDYFLAGSAAEKDGG